MSDDVKISKAFDAFMADSGPNDKRDAIVVYRAPQDGILPSASKDPTDRLNYVKVRADRQRKVHASVVEAYQREGPRRLARRLDLSASSVGSDVLPVSQVEVTTRTLPALAEQPDVVAILPNQKLHPLEPRVVDYRAANKAESNAGLTWGLVDGGPPKRYGVRHCGSTQGNGKAPGRTRQPPRQPLGVRHDSTARSTRRFVVLRRHDEGYREPLALEAQQGIRHPAGIDPGA